MSVNNHFLTTGERSSRCHDLIYVHVIQTHHPVRDSSPDSLSFAIKVDSGETAAEPSLTGSCQGQASTQTGRQSPSPTWGVSLLLNPKQRTRSPCHPSA
jgi:hypothetical protein